jgi:RNA polymerase sigma-70 factor (ECF subfamily)
MTTNGIDACKHVLVLADIYRQHAGRVIATLARYSGDIDLAEDAFQDAIEAALDRWPTNGEPDSPAAWLTTVARRKMIDRLRRDERGREKTQLLASDATLASPTPSPTTASSWSSPVVIPRAPEARVALTLRTLGGLSTSQIAHAFLVPEATMAQRLVRAKRKIEATGIPFEVPADRLLADQVNEVLRVVYLVFNEGYTASEGDALIRSELCAEAIRLARILRLLLPDEADWPRDRLTVSSSSMRSLRSGLITHPCTRRRPTCCAECAMPKQQWPTDPRSLAHQMRPNGPT